MKKEFDVIIIGGGWSGLVTCKHMLEANLSSIVFEKRDGIGGVWKYSDDPSIVTVTKNTVTTSSSTITEISDFPMPDDCSYFPHHSKVYKYLNSYCDEFNLRPHIKTSTEIVKARKEQDRWVVTTSEGKKYSSKFLCICSGTHQIPNEEVIDTVFKDFKGEIKHSLSYKHPLPEHIGKKILIYGGGETASDLATELSYVADKVYCSIPHGQWFQYKMDKGEPSDHFSSRLRRWCSPMKLGCPLIVHSLESRHGLQNHGVEEWRSPAPYYGQFFNKSPAVLERIRDGFVIPLPDVKKVHAHKILFKNDKEFEIDYVLLSTGYHPVFHFLPKEYSQSPRERLKLIFDPNDPSLAFIGLIRPTVTSIPAMAETQIRCVVNVFTGKVKIPPREEVDRIIAKDNAFLDHQFEKTTQRITALIDPNWYIEEVAKFGKFRPNYLKLFFENPYFWYLCITAPAHSSMFLVHDRKYRPYLTKLYKKLRAKPFTLRYFLDMMGGWVFVRIIEACMRFYRRIWA